VTKAPPFVAGPCESANLSQRSRRKFSESQCERPRGSVRTCESVPSTLTESVCRRRRMRSHVGSCQQLPPSVCFLAPPFGAVSSPGAGATSNAARSREDCFLAPPFGAVSSPGAGATKWFEANGSSPVLHRSPRDTSRGGFVVLARRTPRVRVWGGDGTPNTRRWLMGNMSLNAASNVASFALSSVVQLSGGGSSASRTTRSA
jgi:hypothetical protein